MPTHILLIEDNPGDARLVRAQLSSTSSGDLTVDHAKRLSEGLEHLAEDGADVVLLDLNLPDSRGLDTFTTLFDRVPDIPIIVLSGLADRRISVQAVRNGAQDYIVKGDFDGDILARAISYAIERKQAELRLKHALEEKTILLKEIHHRVKNNLQIIASLLSLQMDKIQDDSIREIVRPCQDRVVAMGMVYNRLYTQDDMSDIDIAKYTIELTTKLASSYRNPAFHISIIYDCEPICLSVDLAVPYGLILTELVTNAFKHAFPGREAGEIYISLHEIDGFVNMVVADNGVGMPSGFAICESNSLGLQLVEGLAKQIHGCIDVRNESGAVVKVRFPLITKGMSISGERDCQIIRET